MGEDAGHPDMIAAFQEATEMLNKDVKEASQAWLDSQKTKLTLEKVVEIASGKQVRWTMAPENTMKYAEFMHSVGTIKAMPSSWKDLFFPEIHALPGS
jgi:NitT/TauT family transport system substrate-binding protein